MSSDNMEITPIHTRVPSSEADAIMALAADTLDSILPVQLEDDSMREYQNAFFPPRKTPKGLVAKRQHYPEMYQIIGSVSANVNAVLAFSRYVYLQLPRNIIGDAADKTGISRHLKQVWEDLTKSIDESAVQSAVRTAMGSASMGQAHIITKSARYPGGYDVVFSGVPNGAYGRTSTVFNEKMGAMYTLPEAELQIPQSIKESNFAELAQALANEAHAWIYNLSAAPNFPWDTRHVQQFQMKAGMWDAAALTAGLNNVMRKYGYADIFPGMPVKVEVPADMLAGLGKFFSFLVVKEPNHSVIRQKINNPGASEDMLIAAKMAPLLEAEFGMSIAMNLPKENAEFITQTEPGKRLSLVSLNTWVNTWARALIKPRGAKVNKGSGDRLTPVTAPRYVLSPSTTPQITERRKKLGLHAEKTRGNEDNLYLSNTGRFNFCPTSDDVVVENAKSYEDLQEKALEMSFDAGAPLITSQIGYASPYFAYKDQPYKDNIRKVKSDLTKYAGALQTYSWDYNCILTSSRSDPDRLISIPLTGASRPDSLAISEYLTKPANESLFLLFPNNEHEDVNDLTKDDLGHPRTLLQTKLFKSVYQAYEYMVYQGKAPDFKTLVERAVKALGYETLEPLYVGETEARYDVDLYTEANGRKGRAYAIISKDLKVMPYFELMKIDHNAQYDPAKAQDAAKIEEITGNIRKQSLGVADMLTAAMEDATGKGSSNLSRINQRDGGNLEDDVHYFDLTVHNFGEFAKLYNYLGGRVFYEMLQVIVKANVRDLSIVDPRCPIKMPAFESVVKEIKPLATLLGKYAMEAEAIIAEGQEISEALAKDQSVTPDDIHLPGSKSGFQMFPHQIETMQTLAQEKPPRFSVLDIAPGGGKTIIGLTDIGNLIHRGLIKRPVVLCPNGLVRNWIEDMHSVTEGKWNLIPLTTMTYKTWGEERLTKLIQEAPINTIFVVGLSFLRLNTYQVVIGNHAEKVSGTLEFCKKFGFDYVIFDESHKGKNARSHTHKAIKQLTVASTVKYVRLATGTLIQTKLTDVVGQSALMGAHIFRTQEEYEDENSVPAGRGSAVVFAADTPYRARRQLAKHAAVISFKRKEWAFLLPRPIETFISVKLDADEDPLGKAHQMMYQAVLTSTLEEIKNDKTVMGLMSGKGEDSDSDDDEDSPEALYAKAGEILGGGIGGMSTGSDDLDDAELADLEAALQPYLARLEMMLTDPLGDPFGEKYLGAMQKENYVSRKVKHIIGRINLNFVEQPWEKGKTYGLKDLADFKGQRYVLMGKPGEKLTLDSYNETYVSVLEPNRDPRWKPEPFGKVIVFCRYTRSVNAIMRALPPHLKKLAVPFSGGVKDKWQNLEDFRTTPFSKDKGVQILVANEQAISEGHNLQMASRIVRVESPWSPGELDQSSARIFRPDTTGQFRRENVYLDWVLCNNTLEVAKLGRLISRMIDKAKFDEADNPLYSPLQEKMLFPISMSLETIAATPMLADIGEYLETYTQLVKIQSAEFEDMRQTKPSSMLPVETTPMPEGSAIIEHVPYLPSLKSVPDRHGYGLTKLTAFLQDGDSEDSARINADKKLLVGMYAHTEFGNGMIIQVREAKGVDDAPSKVTSVRVQLANGDEYTADPAMIYLAENITKENAKDFTPKTRWTSAKDKKKAAREEAARERALLKEEKRLELEAAREAKLRKRLKKLKADEEAATKAKKAGGRSRRAPIEEPEIEDDPLSLDLYPVVYNGYLAIEATPGEDDAKDMKKLGFKNFGAYGFVQVKDKISFDALLVWLDKKFYLRRETRKRLADLAESFQTGRGRKFAVELSPMSEFRNFYNISHKLSAKDKATGLPELKIYPVIINGSLFLNVDMSTNPIFNRYLNKVIPGTKNLKFQEADGLYIQFFNNRTEVVRWTKGIIADGVQIENYEEFKSSVDELKEKLKIMQKMMK